MSWMKSDKDPSEGLGMDNLPGALYGMMDPYSSSSRIPEDSPYNAFRLSLLTNSDGHAPRSHIG